MDQMLRLLHDCGLSSEDVDFINSDGVTMNKLLLEVCAHYYSFFVFLSFSMHGYRMQLSPTLFLERRKGQLQLIVAVHLY